MGAEHYTCNLIAGSKKQMGVKMFDKEQFSKQEKNFSEKNPGIIGFQYDKSNPRATTCIIAFKLRKTWQCREPVGFVVGVAIRNKKDPEDDEFACKLAFKRAKKLYYKKIRAQRIEKHD